MNLVHPMEPIPDALLNQPDFAVSPALGAEIDELITHYPQKRSASLMLLHAIQERFGYISRQAVEWTAAKLDLQPINIYEAAWQISFEGVPHLELRSRRLSRASRAFL